MQPFLQQSSSCSANALLYILILDDKVHTCQSNNLNELRKKVTISLQICPSSKYTIILPHYHLIIVHNNLLFCDTIMHKLKKIKPIPRFLTLSRNNAVLVCIPKPAILMSIASTSAPSLPMPSPGGRAKVAQNRHGYTKTSPSPQTFPDVRWKQLSTVKPARIQSLTSSKKVTHTALCLLQGHWLAHPYSSAPNMFPHPVKNVPAERGPRGSSLWEQQDRQLALLSDALSVAAQSRGSQLHAVSVKLLVRQHSTPLESWE